MAIKNKEEIKGNAKCKEYLGKVSGSIANVLTKHARELEPLMLSPSQLPQLKAKVNEIILSDEVGESFGKERAAAILGNINHWGKYMSSLAAYMSGIAVGQ